MQRNLIRTFILCLAAAAMPGMARADHPPVVMTPLVPLNDPTVICARVIPYVDVDGKRQSRFESVIVGQSSSLRKDVARAAEVDTSKRGVQRYDFPPFAWVSWHMDDKILRPGTTADCSALPVVSATLGTPQTPKPDVGDATAVCYRNILYSLNGELHHRYEAVLTTQSSSLAKDMERIEEGGYGLRHPHLEPGPWIGALLSDTRFDYSSDLVDCSKLPVAERRD